LRAKYHSRPLHARFMRANIMTSIKNAVTSCGQHWLNSWRNVSAGWRAIWAYIKSYSRLAGCIY